MVLCVVCIGVFGIVILFDFKNVGVFLDDECFVFLFICLSNCLWCLELDCWYLSDVFFGNLFEGLEELVLCGCYYYSDELLVNVVCRMYVMLWCFVWLGFGGCVIVVGF